MTEFVGLIAKVCSYLKHDGSEDKKAKGTRKLKLKIENYKNSLEATQLENTKNYLEKSKFNIHSCKRNRQFIRSNKSILKTHYRFKRKRHNVLTKKLTRLL